MSTVIDYIGKTEERLNNLKEDGKSGPRMTKEAIRKHCKEHKLFLTPYLNDVLYLHFKGYSYIENLEEYVGLKCLWLENNGLLRITNLENQVELRCLYLHNNLIDKIENLDALKNLDTINLCHNYIKKIENLSVLPVLKTLMISHNKLSSFEDISHLMDCKELSTVDLSHNQIDDQKIVEIMGAMQSLRVLNLLGNPVRNKINFYRKVLTLECEDLQYLDDRPVFPKDRVCAEAWRNGGDEAEELARKTWVDNEQKKLHASVMALLSLKKRKKYQSALDVESNQDGTENRERTFINETIDSGSKSEVDSSSCSSSSEEEQNSDDEIEGEERIVMPWDANGNRGETMEDRENGCLIEEICEENGDQNQTIIFKNVKANNDSDDKDRDGKIKDVAIFTKAASGDLGQFQKQTDEIPSQSQLTSFDKREKFIKICETIEEENENASLTPPALDTSDSGEHNAFCIQPFCSIIELKDSEYPENIISKNNSKSSLNFKSISSDDKSEVRVPSVIEVVNANRQGKCEFDHFEIDIDNEKDQKNVDGGKKNDKESIHSAEEGSSNDDIEYQMIERLQEISENCLLKREFDQLTSTKNSLSYDGTSSPDVNIFIKKIENVKSEEFSILGRIGKTERSYIQQSKASADINTFDQDHSYSKIISDTSVTKYEEKYELSNESIECPVIDEGKSEENENGIFERANSSSSDHLATLNSIRDDNCSKLKDEAETMSESEDEYCTRTAGNGIIINNKNVSENDISNQNTFDVEDDEKVSTNVKYPEELNNESLSTGTGMQNNLENTDLEMQNENKSEDTEGKAEAMTGAISSNGIPDKTFNSLQNSSENNSNLLSDKDENQKLKNYSLELQMAVEASK
ncbi:hypothetical protein LSTR_LSTR005305 [Laodelphax striatellus]|uniref:Dynein axonemal assembly factor 1 homolog n=1 Tax=Laodelphax striatellus TaxID=195883 RepID=A0A482X7Y8_LAOST|nr:hypothetical protein LSTR_LSTR005305 [Laodelphax striatellus]